METSPDRPQITLVQLVVALAIGGLLVAVLIPFVLRAREQARRDKCSNYMKYLGLGLLNYESTFQRFPSTVCKNPGGMSPDIYTRGWSWHVSVLPYLEGGGDDQKWMSLWTFGPLENSPVPRGWLACNVPELHCPSFKGSPYVDPKIETEAITNYKAMGASHLSSLLVASPTPSVPKYNPQGEHPDGALYPGSRHGISAFEMDGVANTILVCESKEQNVARWTVGAETCLVGLPEKVAYTNKSAKGKPLGYFAPTGYSPGKFGDRTTIPTDNNLSYLDWDYDAEPYVDNLSGVPLVPRSARASGPMKYGPSSDHPGVVNHAFADGSVRPLSNEIDAAAYMFMITRNGHEGYQVPDAEP